MAVPDDIVAKVGRRLAEHAGLELPAWVLASRIGDRLAALGVDAHGYLGLVNAPRGRGELHLLTEAVRVGETRFFRHAAQVQALIDVVVPAWRARGRRQFRAWSAGCATGEEPYTLAMVLAPLVGRGGLSILATDVSDEALAAARAARYPAAARAHVPAPWQDGLIVDGDAARVRPELARLVAFERHNLVDDEAPRGFDLVWCRNVLIYFGAAARAHAVEHLVAACEPGGFVFLGYSETLRDVAGLEPVRAGECTVYRRDAAGPMAAARAGASGPMPVSASGASGAMRASSSGVIAARAGGASGASGAMRARRASTSGSLAASTSGSLAASTSGSLAASTSGSLAASTSGPMSAASAATSGPMPAATGPATGAPRARASGPIPARAAAPIPPRRRTSGSHAALARFALRGHCADAAAVAGELTRALGRPGIGQLVVDLDEAEFLADEIVPVLRRARAAAEAAGVIVTFAADRPGAQRWLRRHRLDAAEEDAR